jgi:hypothetical protein
MRELTPVDQNMVLRRLPAGVRQLLKNNILFVAGGFIREVIAGNEVQDIDVFGPDPFVLDSLADQLATERGGRTHGTQFATTVLAPPRAPVQFIKKWNYSEPRKLLEELDFTICQACVWYEPGLGWASMCADDFYSDLAARRLVYTFPQREEAAGGSMMRVRKFLARGYRINADSLAGVVARLVDKIDGGRVAGLMAMENIPHERAMHKVVKGLLHEVDPLIVIDQVEPRDEEEEAIPD